MPIDINQIMQHQLYLHRLESGIVNGTLYPSLEDAYRAIRRELMAAENINTPTKLKRIVRIVNDEIDSRNGWGTITESLEETAEYEAGFQAEFITAAAATQIKTPTRKQVRDFMEQSLMTVVSGQRVQSQLWGEFVQNNIASQKQVVDGLIRQGYMQGDTVTQIANRIRAAVNGIVAREAESLARTGFNHYMTGARRAMAEAQSIPMIERPIVVFDNRTSNTCIGISARYQEDGWPAGQSPIGYSPYHYGCRTTIVALPEGEELTGTRAAVGGKSGEEAAEAFQSRENRLRTASQVRYRGRRDSNIFDPGQVKASTGYGEWLQRQPVWFQNDTLGPARAKLFREGMDVERFTDMTGRTLTLDELRARDADLFERAGL